MSTETNDPRPCPECAQGKCFNCTLEIPTADDLNTQPCPCAAAGHPGHQDGVGGPRRRTKRRLAHELYPHAPEHVVRPLEIEVPYLYAQMVGLEVEDSDWFDLWQTNDLGKIRLANRRIVDFQKTMQLALLADALLQGMGGAEAWEWAMTRHVHDEDAETAYGRAAHYGITPDQIRPYLILGDPTTHNHYDVADELGRRRLKVVPGSESGCVNCTEIVEESA